MKKRITVILLITTLLLAGCGNKQNTDSEQGKSIVKVENTIGHSIYVDKDTGVMYLYVYSGYGGGITVMINEDGTPKLEYCYKADGTDTKGECLPGENKIVGTHPSTCRKKPHASG